MLNPNYLALRAARRLCEQYRLQNKQLFKEYCSALAKIKTAIGNEFSLVYRYNNNDYSLTLYFDDPNGNEIEITFYEYTEKRLADTFANAFFNAKNLNTLCYGK